MTLLLFSPESYLLTMVASADYDPVVVEVPLSDARLREFVEYGKKRRESAKLDFKEAHDPSSSRDKVELTKDLVAMANTAGGYVVIGIDNAGVVCGLGPSEAAKVDEAKLRMQTHSFTGVSLELFFETAEWEGAKLGVITVLRSPSAPVVFQKDGQYKAENGPQTAFRGGDVFVRHGSSSERWNQHDVQTIYARVVERERERWLREVLPDLLRASSASSATPGHTFPVTPRSILSQDAESFEQTIREIVRRLP